jgi:hypothetical protein
MSTQVIHDIHDRLAEAFALIGQPGRETEALAPLLAAYNITETALAAPPEPTPAAQCHGRFATPFTLPLPSGIVVRVHGLDVVSEILAQTLPNRVLEHVVYGQDGPKDDTPKAAQDYVLGLHNIAVRALIFPRLVLDRAPNYAAGEIGKGDLRLDDLRMIRQRVLWDSLPVVQDAPFRVSTDDA